jgi:hypothetical protein
MQLRHLAASILVCTAVAAPTGAQQPTYEELSVEDVVRIQQLYSRYHWATDATNAAAWADLFVPDGEFESGTQKYKGRADMVAYASKALGTPKANGALHLQTNIRFEKSPEGARGGSYMLLVIPGEPGKPPTITTVVIYQDVLVKTPEGWRFKSRRSVSRDVGLMPSLMWPDASR